MALLRLCRRLWFFLPRSGFSGTGFVASSASLHPSRQSHPFTLPLLMRHGMAAIRPA
jgi:hypothetical protein